MLDPKSNSIVIVRPGDKPQPLDDEMLQHYVEESHYEASGAMRMAALFVLVILVGIGAAVFGLIIHLLSKYPG